MVPLYVTTGSGFLYVLSYTIWPSISASASAILFTELPFSSMVNVFVIVPSNLFGDPVMVTVAVPGSVLFEYVTLYS